jgi:hypothetical protein
MHKREEGAAGEAIETAKQTAGRRGHIDDTKGAATLASQGSSAAKAAEIGPRSGIRREA